MLYNIGNFIVPPYRWRYPARQMLLQRANYLKLLSGYTQVQSVFRPAFLREGRASAGSLCIPTIIGDDLIHSPSDVCPNHAINVNKMHFGVPREPAFLYRHQLKHARRIVIKLGSSVVTREDGNGLALGRLASIVEQVSELQNQGHQCILISSGAVAYGKQKLAQELTLSMSMRDTIAKTNVVNKDPRRATLSSLQKPNAAVGQSGLQALYETMFRNYGILVGQVLVTASDFSDDDTCAQLFSTIDELLQLNIIPIINTNDAVSPPPKVTLQGECTESATERSKIQTELTSNDGMEVGDNDSLAARIAAETGTQLALLMTNVDGILDEPPGSDSSSPPRVIHTFNPADKNRIKFGGKSGVGTGGMESKIGASLWALDQGCSVVICNGMQFNTIRKVMAGQKIGSFFTNADADTIPVELMARDARNTSRRLLNLDPSSRANIINHIADSLSARTAEILMHNEKDVEMARQQNVSAPLLSRLQMSDTKIKTLVTGLHQIADASHTTVGRELRHIKVSETIDLVQRTTPIGVLLVIFESRPDCLPQLAALSIASANGLLVKGGKEAHHTNTFLLSLIKDALARYECEGAVSMVSSREAIGDLLKMENYIDLIIPRGSSDLVKSIKEQSRLIPVLGHAEGVCHVYIDKSVDMETVKRIVRDAKVNYPAACNAMETLLMHENIVKSGQFNEICSFLHDNLVEMFVGPKLSRHLIFTSNRAKSMRTEYGDLKCTVEMVSDLDEAVEHINTYGSGHTDAIITSDEAAAKRFQNTVDSACVMVNCSTRMSDGYRFGLGAEVGISTGRIHARGPVGVEGLLTSKWFMSGTNDTAEDYDSGSKQFVHEYLPCNTPSSVKNRTSASDEDDQNGKLSYLS